jgi:hypothetical protein
MGPRWCAGKARPRPNDRYLTAAFSCGIVNECNCELVLKNSVSAPNGQILGDRKCLAIREDRLYRILAQFHFCDFCRNEFFNSHGILPQLAFHRTDDARS